MRCVRMVCAETRLLKLSSERTAFVWMSARSATLSRAQRACDRPCRAAGGAPPTRVRPRRAGCSAWHMLQIGARPPCERRGGPRARALASAAAWGRWTHLSAHFPGGSICLWVGEEGWLVRAPASPLARAAESSVRAIGLARSCLGRLDMYVGSLNASRRELSEKYRLHRRAGKPRAARGSGVGLSRSYGPRRRREAARRAIRGVRQCVTSTPMRR